VSGSPGTLVIHAFSYLMYWFSAANRSLRLSTSGWGGAATSWQNRRSGRFIGRLRQRLVNVSQQLAQPDRKILSCALHQMGW
jgi:hypothetical protein